MVRIVTFDVYGTLVDWRYSISGFIERYVSRDAVEDYFKCDLEEVRFYRPYKEILRSCLKRVMSSRGLEYNDLYGEAFVRSFARSPPFPDTIYGLLLLKRHGFRVGVISNTDRDLIETTLQGFRDLVDYIVTAEDTKYYKPDPKAFERAIEIMRVDPGEILHVSAYPQYDLDTARSIGLKCVHLNRYGYEWKPEIKRLDELIDYISTVTR